MLDQPEARALLVYDQRVHDEWMMAPYVEGVEPLDKFQLAYAGAHGPPSPTRSRSSRRSPTNGVIRGRPLATRCSSSIGNARPAHRSPSRKLDAAPLVSPPFYVIEVIPAITFTFSGLSIDPHARVLNESGQVIPGLLAAGADAGGVFNRAYAGGLACALVFGLQAAATATAERAASA